MKKIEQMN